MRYWQEEDRDVLMLLRFSVLTGEHTNYNQRILTFHSIYADGRGSSVSACADLTNQVQCCWVDPAACKVKKSSMARSLPVVNILPQNVGSTINYLQ